MSKKYTIEVVRHRASVTQGTVEVKFEGKRILLMSDEIRLEGSNDDYCGAKGRPTYGENMGGWASVLPDEHFVAGLFSDEWPIGETVSARVKRVLAGDSEAIPPCADAE